MLDPLPPIYVRPSYFGRLWIVLWCCFILLAYGIGVSRSECTKEAEKIYAIYNALERENRETISDYAKWLLTEDVNPETGEKLSFLERNIIKVAANYDLGLAEAIAFDIWGSYRTISDSFKLALWALGILGSILFCAAIYDSNGGGKAERLWKKDGQLIKWYWEHQPDVVLKALKEAEYIDERTKQEIATWLNKHGYRAFRIKRMS